MPSVHVVVPEALAARRFAGRTVVSHWEALLEEAGCAAGAADDADLELDGTRLGLSAAGLRAWAAGDATLEELDAAPVQDELDVAAAERRLIDRVVAGLGRAGVVLHDPARIWVEPSVQVAAGAVLWGGCVLRGRTRVASGAEIGVGAVLVDTEVGPGSQVKPYTVCQEATIGAGSAVGPMAHLRPGSDLRDDVKVGNFVEVKQTVLHEGVRASHLTYLGDAEVFERANVGAGTITCNYDGFGKHRTEIGAGAFVGSNSALVAPVRIGAGAIVGAGSTVTHEVPDGALMVERAEERRFEGKAHAINERNRRRAEARKHG